jgi:hypothetical protein
MFGKDQTFESEKQNVTTYIFNYRSLNKFFALFGIRRNDVRARARGF